EEFVRPGVELPVDLARFVAAFVGAVLGELQPGAAAVALVQADALAADRPARDEAQALEPASHVERKEVDHQPGTPSQASGMGVARTRAAMMSSALRPSASAAKDSSRRWRMTGAARAMMSSRVAAR